MKMKLFNRIFYLVLLFTCYLSSLLVSGCVFTAPKQKKIGIWDLRNYPRKIWTKDGGCSCGTYDPSKTDPSSPKTWLLYVLISDRNPEDLNLTALCTGTILTSNFVAVSHTCLLQSIENNRKIQIYETWRPPPKLTSGNSSVVTPDKILLSTHLNKTVRSIYHVKDIILSARYAHSVFRESGIQDDVALLVTKDDLFENGHNSVCLPSSSFLHANKDEKLEDLLHSRLGFYYDSTAELTDTPTSGVEAKNKLEKVVILRASDCDTENSLKRQSEETNLCVRFLGNSLEGYEVGGPLLAYAQGSEASFLVGMAIEKNRPKNESSWYSYAYFTNMLSLVRYIDMHAYKERSEWCQEKEFKLGPKVEINSVDTYPWKDGSYTRKEDLDCTCGIRNSHQNKSKADSRIAGGVEAELYEFPWMVLLHVWVDTGDESYTCGASVVNDRVILTAAHCVVEQDGVRLPINVEVQINVHYSQTNDLNKKYWEVKNIYYHPDYVKKLSDATTPGDIALITLKNPINFSKLRVPGGPTDYRPICLHSKPPNPGEIATVAGWGRTDPNNPESLADALQKLDVPIIPRSKCQDQYDFVTDNHLCAGYFNANKDNTHGDSGGPLFLPDKSNGQFYQVGVVSFGSDVFNSGKEDLEVYTNVQKYLDFIDYYSEREGARWCQRP